MWWMNPSLLDFVGNHEVGASFEMRPVPQASFIADGLFQRLEQVRNVLAPVIGEGGVVALFERSRQLSSRPHAWLAAAAPGLRSGMDLAELRSVVARQDDQAAAAGAASLLKTFHDLLAGLIGEPLTRQLLGAPPSVEPVAGSAS